jgi:hypothetical protein
VGGQRGPVVDLSTIGANLVEIFRGKMVSFSLRDQPCDIVFLFSKEPSSDESDTDSDLSYHIPSVFRFESLHDLQPVSDSPEPKPNCHIPQDELRVLVGNYVQGILRHSADVLGVEIKFQEKAPREQIQRITDVKRIRKLP